jgi:hypothetical protein
MSTIVAGRFDTHERAERALESLVSRGFRRGDTSEFFVNPAGQHHQIATGGDQFADAEASRAHVGAGVGAAAGGALATAAAIAIPGLAPMMVLGVAALGAFSGSFLGTMSTLGDDSKADDKQASPGRRGGEMVAVRVLNEEAERVAIEVLREHGAQDVERREGEWRDGQWRDFDPVSPPHRVEGQS